MLFLVVFCFLIFASYPQSFFPLSSFSEALLALSLPFLSEWFFFVYAKAALAHSRNHNTGVTGQFLPPKNDFEHARGPRYPAYAFWTRQIATTLLLSLIVTQFILRFYHHAHLFVNDLFSSYKLNLCILYLNIKPPDIMPTLQRPKLLPKHGPCSELPLYSHNDQW